MKKVQNTPKSIFITGASSGIGKAISIQFAAPGITLFLCGRNMERLKQTADACNKKGAITHIFQFDTTNKDESKKFVLKANEMEPLDLLIANAGVSGGVLGKEDSEESIRQIFDTNMYGVINTVLPIIDIFKKRKKGQIALMSSIAGFRGLMNCPAYSSSKNFVKAWGEALRGALKEHNIKVNVICPGFVKTPLTDKNLFKMPFLMQPEKAAKIIQNGIQKNKSIIAFPMIMHFSIALLTALPRFITNPIFEYLPQKEKKTNNN
jgi:short-subunit dehydrogenase